MCLGRSAATSHDQVRAVLECVARAWYTPPALLAMTGSGAASQPALPALPSLARFLIGHVSDPRFVPGKMSDELQLKYPGGQAGRVGHQPSRLGLGMLTHLDAAVSVAVEPALKCSPPGIDHHNDPINTPPI